MGYARFAVALVLVSAVPAAPRCWRWSLVRAARRGRTPGWTMPSMAIVRRDVFENAQWEIAGQRSLSVRHAQASPYLADPSQMVLPRHCRTFGSDFAAAIGRFPRAAFTPVWAVGFSPGAAKAGDLRLIWTNGRSSLYRVVC